MRQQVAPKEVIQSETIDDSASDQEETKQQTPGNSVAHVVHQNEVQWEITLIRARKTYLGDLFLNKQ